MTYRKYRDWKKLTFYYFADSYINFNSLVTDLFKIYKTRIWMSAINPASFASPTLGIQAPSGIGPGAVSAGRSSGANDRRQNQPQPEQQTPGFAPAGRGFRPPFNQQPFVAERPMPPGSGYPPSNYGYSQPGVFGTSRNTTSYMPGASPGLDGFPGVAYQQPGEFQPMRHRFPPSQSASSPTHHAQGVPSMTSQPEWTNAFQGLSLNSH